MTPDSNIVVESTLMFRFFAKPGTSIEAEEAVRLARSALHARNHRLSPPVFVKYTLNTIRVRGDCNMIGKVSWVQLDRRTGEALWATPSSSNPR